MTPLVLFLIQTGTYYGKKCTEKNVQLNFEAVTIVDWSNQKCLVMATVPNFDSEQTSFWWLKMMLNIVNRRASFE